MTNAPRNLLLCSILLLAACSSNYPSAGPTEKEIAAFRESQNIFPADYRNDLLAFLRSYLNDPSGIRSAGVSMPERKTFGAGERYVACLRYDAKKSSGGYAGVKTALIVFVSGKLDRLVEGGETPEGAQARELCKGVSFSPFPEAQRLTR